MISQEARDKLNMEILEHAVKNFEEWCKVMNFDEARAQICHLKAKGKSYTQISIILGRSRDQVIGIYRRNCGCIQPQETTKK